MHVNNRHMYHFHPEGCYDDVWKIGNSFTVDDKWESIFKKLTFNCSEIVQGRENDIYIARYIVDILKEDLKNLSHEDLIVTLRIAAKTIQNRSMALREIALEEYRRKNCPELPSRFSSIWVTNKAGIKFWEEMFTHDKYSGAKESRELLELELTGNLFKSSDEFLPQNGVSYKKCLEAAEMYWNPDFSKEHDRSKVEYLFQGNVRVLKKINRDSNN